MYIEDDIPASRKKLGWYEFEGKKYSNKYHALEKCPNEQSIHFNFHDDIFSNYNWSERITDNIYNLYLKRALQLREKYDYLIIYYSGGIDSHCVLRTFIDNNIKLDGIIVSGSYSIDSKIETTCNKEQILVAQSYLKKLKNEGKLRCPVYYLDTVEHHKNFKDENWVFNCGSNLSPQIYTYNFYWQDPWIQNFLMKGKTGFIRGVDKPRVVLENGNWYGAFIDIHVLSGTPTGYLNKNQDWDIQEYFYWTPDMPEIAIAQCQLMVEWFENNLSPELSEKYTTKNKEFNRAKYNNIADPLMYGKYITQKPGESKDYFSLGKPSFTNLWHKDYWFIQSRDVFSKEYNVWQSGLEMLSKKIHSDKFNKPSESAKQELEKFIAQNKINLSETIKNSNILFGTVGNWSRFHLIKPAYKKI